MFIIGSYREGQKCPACSSERDKGGRLHKAIRSVTSYYLKCQVCRYSVTETKVSDRDRLYVQKKKDKALFKATPNKMKAIQKEAKRAADKLRTEIQKNGLLG